MGNPWFRILWCRLFGGCVVAVEDHDGEVVFRRARMNVFGKLVCTRYPGFYITLLDGGKVSGLAYAERWIPIWPKSGEMLAKFSKRKEPV